MGIGRRVFWHGFASLVGRAGWLCHGHLGGGLKWLAKVVLANTNKKRYCLWSKKGNWHRRNSKAKKRYRTTRRFFAPRLLHQRGVEGAMANNHGAQAEKVNLQLRLL
jgi:hypothetical protein